MTERRKRARWIVAAVLAAAVIGPMATGATAKTKIKQPLAATVHAPGASGVAKLVLKSGSRGRFIVKAHGLAASKSFHVVVDDIKVGSLVTDPTGAGVARFSNSGRGRFAMLGFDPRGAHIVVRDGETGEDDLECNGHHDGGGDGGDSAMGCCVGETGHEDREGGDGDVECKDLTAAECVARGGTPTTAASCLPDPCRETPPPVTVVCCHTGSAAGAFVDEDPDVGCEDDVSAKECAASGGTVVEASSCEPNPCKPVPPPDVVVCCVPEGDESECEHVTREHCMAAGGTVSTATSCEAHPCGGCDGHDGKGDDGDGDDEGGHDGGDEGGHHGGRH
jgi:hypothetical protein